MAEARRFADLRYGHVGKLSYTPRDGPPDEPGLLHTSRLTSDCPHFKRVGSSAELYPPPKSDPPQWTHSGWKTERNLQKRWLLKSHPQASMGNSHLSGLLTEEAERFGKLDDASTPRSLLAIGEMTDVSIPSRPSAAPVLAVATGESGELLRLARIQDSQWAWDDDKHSTLHLSVIDPQDKSEEIVWGSDGLPISQIKFAKSESPPESIRWLLVQKETSTTILHPEYSKIPKTKGQSYQLNQHTLSRINPRHVVTLGHGETGGNAHSDVDFNVPTDGRAPQLCVMDESGYWTLWNITGFSRSDKKSVRLSLYRCGHIWQGTLNEIPSTPSYPAQKHGVLFVGGVTRDDFCSAPSPASGSSRGATVQPGTVLLWNRERFEIVDTEANSRLPKLEQFSSTKVKYGRILDVQLSPVNQDHAFILTERYIVWINVFSSSNPSIPASKPVILLTCAHMAVNNAGLKMAINRTSESDDAQPMVFIYSTDDKQVSIHWFRLSAGNGPAQWHSQMASLPPGAGKKPQPSGFQQVAFQPSSLTCIRRASDLGAKYRREDVQFYQGMLLGADLGVRYCMCFTSTDPSHVVTLPVTRIGWTNSDQNRRWKKKRLQILRHIGETVVVPDTMTDEAIQCLARRPRDTEDEVAKSLDTGVSSRKPTSINMDRLIRAVQDDLENVHGYGKGLPMAVLDAIQGAIQNGQAAGRLSLMTWRDVINCTGLNEESESPPEEDTEASVQEFLSGVGDQAIVTQLGRRAPGGPAGSVHNLSQLHRNLSEVWVEPLREKLSERSLQMREAWVTELVRELYLSTQGVAVQDIPLFCPAGSTRPPDSQRTITGSSIHIESSQPSSPRIPSSPPTGKATPPPDETFQRLQLLAPSIQPGKIGATKQASVLSYWPTERGVDTKDYVSSVAIATERKFDDARQRLQRMVARRKAQAEKYKRPAAIRQTAPPSQRQEASRGVPIRPQAPTQIMSSQQAPGSSQIQGPPVVTMSQPVAGAFGGDRKKAKKAKKKSGFR